MNPRNNIGNYLGPYIKHPQQVLDLRQVATEPSAKRAAKADLEAAILGAECINKQNRVLEHIIIVILYSYDKYTVITPELYYNAENDTPQKNKKHRVADW